MEHVFGSETLTMINNDLAVRTKNSNFIIVFLLVQDNVDGPNDGGVSIIDDSSDEEFGCESPSDEVVPNNIDSSRSSSSLRLLNNEDGRDTPTHSDIS